MFWEAKFFSKDCKNIWRNTAIATHRRMIFGRVLLRNVSAVRWIYLSNELLQSLLNIISLLIGKESIVRLKPASIRGNSHTLYVLIFVLKLRILAHCLVQYISQHLRGKGPPHYLIIAVNRIVGNFSSNEKKDEYRLTARGATNRPVVFNQLIRCEYCWRWL